MQEPVPEAARGEDRGRERSEEACECRSQHRGVCWIDADEGCALLGRPHDPVDAFLRGQEEVARFHRGLAPADHDHVFHRRVCADRLVGFAQVHRVDGRAGVRLIVVEGQSRDRLRGGIQPCRVDELVAGKRLPGGGLEVPAF